MTTPFKNIVLIGGTGEIGSMILTSLISSNLFNITLLTRGTKPVPYPPSPSFRIIKTDFSDDSELVSLFTGQDAVISSVSGDAGIQGQKRFIDAAIRAGVKRFLPAEFSTNPMKKAVRDLLYVFAGKKTVLDYLVSKESEGLTWTGVGTSILLEWTLEKGICCFDIRTQTATIWDDGNKPFTMITAKQLGEAVVSVLQHPQETANGYVLVASMVTTQNEMLSTLEEATGTKWTVTHRSTEEMLMEASEKLRKGDFAGHYMMGTATLYADIEGLGSDYTKEEGFANAMLGLEMEDWKTIVKNVVRQVQESG